MIRTEFRINVVQLRYTSIQQCIYGVVASLVCFKGKYHHREPAFNYTDTNETKTQRTP